MQTQQGLYGVDVLNDFSLTTEDPIVIKSADDILAKLNVGNSLLRKKRDFIVNLMVNFKISLSTRSYLAIPRGKDYYSKLSKLTAREYETYDIVTQILDELKDKGYVSSRGYIAKALRTGYYPSKVFNSEIDKVQINRIIKLRPKAFVVLREKYKGENIDIDYKPTNFTRKLEKDLSIYHDLREKTKISIVGVDVVTYTNKKDFFVQNSAQDITANTFLASPTVIELRSGYLSRIFNETFKREGRFYRGVESGMPKEFRKMILINGNPTVELDYSAHHIRMLYHLRRIKILTDPYDVEPNKPGMRDIYKSVFLRCINTGSSRSALQSLWKYFNEDENAQKLLPDNSIDTRKALIEKLMNHNPKIKDDFFKQKCFTLMNKDSNIAHNILMHFASKGILVLCVHDSFIIEQEHKQELEKTMIDKYKKIFKFDPVIK